MERRQDNACAYGAAPRQANTTATAFLPRRESQTVLGVVTCMPGYLLFTLAYGFACGVVAGQT